MSNFKCQISNLKHRINNFVLLSIGILIPSITLAGENTKCNFEYGLLFFKEFFSNANFILYILVLCLIISFIGVIPYLLNFKKENKVKTMLSVLGTSFLKIFFIGYYINTWCFLPKIDYILQTIIIYVIFGSLLDGIIFWLLKYEKKKIIFNVILTNLIVILLCVAVFSFFSIYIQGNL